MRRGDGAVRVLVGSAAAAALDSLRYRTPRPAPSVRLAIAVLAFGREVASSMGVEDPAEATCHALQRVPATSSALGSGRQYGQRLGSLVAGWYSRRNVPRGHLVARLP